MRIARIALGILLLAGCSSTKADDPSVGATSQAIQGGTTDTTHNFVVGMIIGGVQNNQRFGTCSGTLITPNMVVTARHCVDQSPEQIDCTTASFGGRLSNQYWITTSSTMTSQSQADYHKVSQIVTPPGNTMCGADIALLILQNVVDGSEATPIVPGVQYPIDDSRYGTRKFEAIGYGITSPTSNDSGTRRIKQSIRLECLYGSDIFQDCGALTDPDVQKVLTENDFLGGDGACQGDSGSGAYDATTFASSSPVTLGILSRGGADSGNCVSPIYTRLDKWRDLVVQTAATASSNWTLYPKPTPDWTVYVAPPNAPDAGPDAKAKGTAEVGESCTGNKDCAGGLCISGVAGAQVCSQSCTSDASCPTDFSCIDTYCQVGPSAPATPPTTNAATPTTTTTSGCGIRPVDPEPTPWYWAGGLAAVVGMAFARRRKTA